MGVHHTLGKDKLLLLKAEADRNRDKARWWAGEASQRQLHAVKQKVAEIRAQVRIRKNLAAKKAEKEQEEERLRQLEVHIHIRIRIHQAWLRGCVAAWLRGCVAGCVAAWLRGCVAALQRRSDAATQPRSDAATQRRSHAAMQPRRHTTTGEPSVGQGHDDSGGAGLG